MDEKRFSAGARALTKILADLDLLFSLSSDENGELVWRLAPFADDNDPEPLGIVLILRENFLTAFYLSPTVRTPKEQELLKLMELNTRVAMAKVGIAREQGFPDSLWAGAQLPAQAISLEMVQIAIGAVVA